MDTQQALKIIIAEASFRVIDEKLNKAIEGCVKKHGMSYSEAFKLGLVKGIEMTCSEIYRVEQIVNSTILEAQGLRVRDYLIQNAGIVEAAAKNKVITPRIKAHFAKTAPLVPKKEGDSLDIAIKTIRRKCQQ